MDTLESVDLKKSEVLYQFKESGPLRKKELKLITFPIDKETKEGWWIRQPNRARLTWISKKADKRIAWPTIGEAYKDYFIRKNVAIDHHRGMIKLQEKLRTKALLIYEQQEAAAEVRDT